MSSFKINAKNKKTGEMHSIWCIDDYFGRHRYGYVPNIENGEALTEEKFYQQYEPEEKR